jgi:hypothetical protein
MPGVRLSSTAMAKSCSQKLFRCQQYGCDGTSDDKAFVHMSPAGDTDGLVFLEKSILNLNQFTSV